MRPFELNTSRLLLRQWKKSDFPAFSEMNSSSKVMEFFPNKLNKNESNAFAKKLSNLIYRRGWGLWALEEKSSKNFIGFTGLHKTPKGLQFSPAIEIGWRLSDKYWGKGYATESATEVLKFAFEKLQLDEIVSFTSVKNTKSLEVMKRIKMINSNCNFLHPKIPDNHPLQEHVLYRISREQWLNTLRKYSIKELESGINKSNLHREIDFGKRTGNEHWEDQIILP